MPRKKAEPEVLQEETVQPEIAQVEETVTFHSKLHTAFPT